METTSRFLARTMLLGIAACVLAFPAVPASAVNRCVDGKGRVTYQDRACDGAGAKINPQPNTIDTTADVKRREAEALIIKAEAARNDLQRSICQRIADSAARQSIWLNSISELARASAEVEIQIARRQYQEAKCGDPIF